MSAVKQAGQKASLDEQGSSSRTSVERESVQILEAMTGNTGGIWRWCSPLQGENLCSQNLIRVQDGRKDKVMQKCE